MFFFLIVFLKLTLLTFRLITMTNTQNFHLSLFVLVQSVTFYGPQMHTIKELCLTTGRTLIECARILEALLLTTP